MLFVPLYTLTSAPFPPWPAATNGDADEGSYGVAASSIPATAAKALGEDGAGIVLVIGQIANVDDRNRVGIAAAAAGTAKGKPAAARSAVAAAAADGLRKDGFRLAVNGPRVEYIHFAAVTGAASIAANRAQSGAKTSVAAAAAHALGINAFGPASVCGDIAIIGHVDVSAETAIGRAAAVSNQGAAATATAAATAHALREDAMGIGAIGNDLAAGFLSDIHFTATAGAVAVAALEKKNARLTATLAAKTANAFGINAVRIVTGSFDRPSAVHGDRAAVGGLAAVARMAGNPAATAAGPGVATDTLGPDAMGIIAGGCDVPIAIHGDGAPLSSIAAIAAAGEHLPTAATRAAVAPGTDGQNAAGVVAGGRDRPAAIHVNISAIAAGSSRTAITPSAAITALAAGTTSAPGHYAA